MICYCWTYAKFDIFILEPSLQASFYQIKSPMAFKLHRYPQKFVLQQEISLLTHIPFEQWMIKLLEKDILRGCMWQKSL